MQRSQAIKNLLNHWTRSHLADLYSHNMEVQVNVSSDGGDRIDKEFKGKSYSGWTDGINIWKAFRIPYKANSEPEDNDYEIKFDLAKHAEGIGMTGWDWVNRQSLWVAYDFDAIIGHSDTHTKKLTNEELDSIKEKVSDIPWVTIQKSTSGSGLHLYVHIPKVPTENHNIHAALARSILGKMSGIAGYDFESKVDVCGSNMWVWHRKMKDTDGLTLIKKGSVIPESEIPSNWRVHVKVVTRTRRKNLPQQIEDSGKGDIFDMLTGQRQVIKLDEDHNRLIDYFKECCPQSWWWDQDHHMLVCHTYWLKRAFEDGEYKGFFDTLAKGDDRSGDHNCFGFPMRNGAWSIRRYTPGCEEANSWEQDSSGYTRCYFNKIPDFKTACRANNGIENLKGAFVFSHGHDAINAAKQLGVKVEIIESLQNGRETSLSQHKDGRIVCEIKKESSDHPMPGWLATGNKPWTKIFQYYSDDADFESNNNDDLVRHLISDQDSKSIGWRLQSQGVWLDEPLEHIKKALKFLGHAPKEIDHMLGSSVLRPWKLVNKPFQSEYPGDRQWNLDGAQLKYIPKSDVENLNYPHWMKVLEHCGSGLDDQVKVDEWCSTHGICNGADYLKCWVASLFQFPLEPLPYLFFYGPQGSGKSILHEGLSLLFTKGYILADQALTSEGGFSGELRDAILCVIEETNLQRNKKSYNKVKNWVTAKEILIHPKGVDPYQLPNTTHWMQFANSHLEAPPFEGDTRITMCFVDELKGKEIPKKLLLDKLKEEATDFLTEIINLEIPYCGQRLNIPVLDTEDKKMMEQHNKPPLINFLEDMCEYCPGSKILINDFYTQFCNYLDGDEAENWTKRRVGSELPPNFVKGRRRVDAKWCYGNIAWKKDKVEPGKKLYLVNEYLEIR